MGFQFDLVGFLSRFGEILSRLDGIRPDFSGTKGDVSGSADLNGHGLPGPHGGELGEPSFINGG